MLGTDAGRNHYRFALVHAHPDRFILVDEAFRFSGSDFSTNAPWQLVLGPTIMHVRYKIALVAYLDILGFKDLIARRTAKEISQIIRAVKQAVEPSKHKMQLKATTYNVPEDQYMNFSDLSLIVTPVEGVGYPPPGSQLFYLLLHIVHAQARLVIDEGILIRGAVTIGEVVKSSGQIFGPAVVRAYKLEQDFARYPRIIIDDRIFEALKGLPGAWLHDERTNRRDLQLLTRRDTDRRLFVDYLRAVQSELDDPAYYPDCLARHDEVIRKGLQRYSRNCRIRPKYDWLKRYHETTIDRMNRGRSTPV